MVLARVSVVLLVFLVFPLFSTVFLGFFLGFQSLWFLTTVSYYSSATVVVAEICLYGNILKHLLSPIFGFERLVEKLGVHPSSYLVCLNPFQEV